MSEWKKKNVKNYSVSIVKTDPLNVALEKASEHEQIEPVRYIKIALVDKLEKDGFLTDYIVFRGRGRRPKTP